MSTATRFKFYQPFPFCPPTFDIDSIDLTQMEPEYFFIRDLTLEDAMALYWNTESVNLAVSLSGALFLDGATPTTVSFDGSVEFITTPITPRERVCGYQITDVDTNTNDYHLTTGLGTTDYDTIINHVWMRGTIADGGPNYIISQQLDGKYTLWFYAFLRSTAGSEKYASIGGGGTFIGVSGITYLNHIDVAVLSGTVRVHGIAWDNGGATYVSGGSLVSATLTPSYYTY